MKQLPDHAHRPGSDGARPDGPADAPAATLDELTAAVDAANRAMARAVALAGQALTDGAAEAVTGLPLEHHLRLATHTTGGDTAMLLEAADTLRALPATRTAFDDGLLSWGQIRAAAVASPAAAPPWPGTTSTTSPASAADTAPPT